MKKIIILLLVSLTLVSFGICVLVLHKNLDQFEIGLANVLIFCFSFFVFVFLLIKKIRLRKDLKKEVRNIKIVAGVRIYQILKPHYFTFFYGLIASVIFLSFSKRIGFIQIFFLSVGTLSIGFIFALYFKIIFQQYILFNSEGIQFGRRNFFYILRWDNIRQFSIEELHSNPMIFIEAVNPEDCIRYLYIKKGSREKIIQQIFTNFSNNLAMTDYPIIFNSEIYSLSTYLSYKIIEKYVNRPEVRSELNEKVPLEI